MQKFKNYLQDIKINKVAFASYWALFFISLTGIILTITSNFLFDQDMTQKDARSNSQENLYLFLYFTVLSNFTGLATSILVIINIISPENKHLQRFKIMAFVNLIVTMIVFWTLIFPSKTYDNAMKLTSTLFVHAFTPLIMITAWTIDVLYRKYKVNTSYTMTASLNVIFPVTWLIMAIILYFAYGAHAKDAFYPFLKLEQNAWWAGVIYILLIGFSYIGLTLGCVFLLRNANKIVEKHKSAKK